MLGILGNPWSLQDGRVDPDPAAPARFLAMLILEIPAEPTATRTGNQQNGRRIHITMKMVSEFGATLGCRGCLMIGQPHTEECRAWDYRTDGERFSAREAARRQSDQEKRIRQSGNDDCCAQ